MTRLRRWWRGIPALGLAIAATACSGTPAHSSAQHNSGSSHRAASALTQQVSGDRAMSAGFAQPLSNFSAVPPRNAGPVLAGEDSVNASAVKEGIPVASCYVVGSRFANCPAVAARHPQHILTVAVLPSLVARCLDVEPTDATPQQAPVWAWSMIRNHGILHPCFYAGGSWMASVQAAAQAAGLPHCTPQTAKSTKPCYLTHIAIWDGSPFIPPNQDGKQYQSFPTVDLDSYYAYFFAPSKPPVQHVSGTANASNARNVQWGYYGVHGTKGTWKPGVEDFWAAANVYVGHQGKVYVQPRRRNPSAITSGTFWTSAKSPVTRWGEHFNAKDFSWKVWEDKNVKAPSFDCGPFLKVITGFQVKSGGWRDHRAGCIKTLPAGTASAGEATK